MSLCSSPWLFGLQEGLGTSLIHLPSGKVPPRTTTSPAVRGEPALCDVDEVCFKSTGSSHQGNSPRRPQLQASLSGRSAIPGLGRCPLKMVPGTFRGLRFPWQVSPLAGPTSRSERAGKRHLGSVCGCRFAHSEG
uniref:Uncharacterized protein n=1 Tax=Pipistrellus kuhlii TaxID=59472 RepID=A0A7J7V0E0_PIPKU|nr:hypothetical protein mPipKuh1_008625 [Pipistrellus kuhlii]